MCCKCCQYCLESCWWHLIEKRFCYDESIALYEEEDEEPDRQRKEEKNNNVFDNWAFYDSVAIIAGRAVVTIDPPRKTAVPQVETIAPEEVEVVDAALKVPQVQVVEVVDKQPAASDGRRVQWLAPSLRSGYFSRSVPVICERRPSNEDLSKSETTIDKESTLNLLHPPTPSYTSSSLSTFSLPDSPPEPPDTPLSLDSPRRKSLLARRTSKSLTLTIPPRDVPLIRQSSMPRFYLDTPQPHQFESSLIRSPSSALTSPVRPGGFPYDLHAVVLMERERQEREKFASALAVGGHQSGVSARGRVGVIKEKMKLRRVKSSLSTFLMDGVPRVHHM